MIMQNDNATQGCNAADAFIEIILFPSIDTADS